MQGIKASDIDEYIAMSSPEVRDKLSRIREIVREMVPEAQETIKYDIPTFTLKGNLLHFAAYKKHIGFYPVPRNNPALMQDMQPYLKGKSTLQFSLKYQLPYPLIRRVVNELVIDHLARTAEK